MNTTAPSATALDDWPSFNKELSRKTSEQLALWVDRYDRKVINLPTALSVVSVIYDTTSGMIDKDLSDVVADVHKALMREATTK